MASTFDEYIERRHTDSLKFDFAVPRGYPEDIFPMWVADMDFKTPNPVIEALKERVEHGIFGYSETGQEYLEILKNWFETRFDWTIENEWLVKTPGIVFAIHMAVQAFTKEKDSILIQEPVYYPFSQAVINNKRHLVVNELVYNDYHYHIDFEDFEKKIVDNHVKLFILCSPHNPVGRVWTKEELQQMGDICLKHDVFVISDEIHADFVYKGHTHHVFTSIDSRFESNAMICTSPSKTFNQAGLQLSNIFVPNPSRRRQLLSAIDRAGYSQVGTFGIVGCQAAYQYGQEWLEELKLYLQDNIEFVKDYLAKNLPNIHLVDPDGTYLLWLDFSATGLDYKEVNQKMIHEAKVWLDAGSVFGKSGRPFQRINIACPRSTLIEGLERIKKSFS